MNTNEKIHQAFNKSQTVEIENIFKPNTMKQSIRKELLSHIEDCKNDFDEVTHFNMFNEDYYLIGYHNCNEWLKSHNIDVFEGINICKDFESDNYGEVVNDFDNSEKLVNVLVYWYGLELCNELGIELG